MAESVTGESYLKSPETSLRRVPAKPWGRIWVCALLVALVPLAGAEGLWRSRGHQPQIIDNRDLWAYHREQVEGAGPDHLVLIGSSRVRLGFSPAVFRQMVPGHEVTLLAVDGCSFLPTLNDLARDPSFRGTVVAGVVEYFFLPQFYARQQRFVDYYDERWDFDRKVNAMLGWVFQERFVIAQPGLSLGSMVSRWDAQLGDGEPLTLPGHMYVIPDPDGSAKAYFARTDVARVRRSAIERRLRLHRQIRARGISPGLWLRWASVIEPLAQQIRQRGGEVALIRLPTQDEWYELDEIDFPRRYYWDRLAALTSVKTIHFEDIPGLRDIELPDTTHVDARDRDELTRLLVRELIRQGVIAPEPDAPSAT